MPRFPKQAAGRKFTDTEAEHVIEDAARQLGVQSHELDHAIWRYESEQARG
jgi:predicted nuclease of restriction endonuclease-like RecB superfamily